MFLRQKTENLYSQQSLGINATQFMLYLTHHLSMISPETVALVCCTPNQWEPLYMGNDLIARSSVLHANRVVAVIKKCHATESIL